MNNSNNTILIKIMEALPTKDGAFDYLNFEVLSFFFFWFSQTVCRNILHFGKEWKIVTLERAKLLFFEQEMNSRVGIWQLLPMGDTEQ